MTNFIEFRSTLFVSMTGIFIKFHRTLTMVVGGRSGRQKVSQSSSKMIESANISNTQQQLRLKENSYSIKCRFLFFHSLPDSKKICASATELENSPSIRYCYYIIVLYHQNSMFYYTLYSVLILYLSFKSVQYY